MLSHGGRDSVLNSSECHLGEVVHNWCLKCNFLLCTLLMSGKMKFFLLIFAKIVREYIQKCWKNDKPSSISVSLTCGGLWSHQYPACRSCCPSVLQLWSQESRAKAQNTLVSPWYNQGQFFRIGIFQTFYTNWNFKQLKFLVKNARPPPSIQKIVLFMFLK